MRFKVICLAILATSVIAALSIEWREDIDVRSGEMRQQWLLAGFVLSESVSATHFSRMASRFVNSEAQPKWKRVRSSSLCQRQSPYYQYHTAPRALRQFVLMSQFGCEDEQSLIVPEILLYLETGQLAKLEEILSKVEVSDALEER